MQANLYIKLARKHFTFLLLLVVLYLSSFILYITTPHGTPIKRLEASYNLFAPTLSSLILLWAISIFLIKRYFQKPKPRDDFSYQLYWGVSFLIFSILFIGLAFQALGYDFANMNDPTIFFYWRISMIFWVAGMWIGTSKLFTNDKLLIYLPSILIVIVGIIGFVNGLIINKNVEQTMYGFLYTEFIPMSFILGYLFYHYSKVSGLSSAKLLMFGFILLGISYAAWAPWHFQDVIYIYFIFYNIFIVSLAFIFAGFYALPKEILSKSINS